MGFILGKKEQFLAGIICIYIYTYTHNSVRDILKYFKEEPNGHIIDR